MKNKLDPFHEFVKSLKESKPHYLKQEAFYKVASDAHFERMKDHLIKYYSEFTVLHSFMDTNGQIWDCVAVEPKPILRRGKKPLPPPAPLPEKPGTIKRYRTPDSGTILSKDTKDQFGNIMSWPQGTVPMRRVTLDEMSRFETLEHFFQQGLVGKGRRPRPNSPQQITPGVIAAILEYVRTYQTRNGSTRFPGRLI